jgi:hypothetical protein
VIRLLMLFQTTFKHFPIHSASAGNQAKTYETKSTSPPTDLQLRNLNFSRHSKAV